MATGDRIRIAQALGLDVEGDPEIVAAAKLHDAVAVALNDRPPTPSTDRQRQFGAAIGLSLEADTVRVASARIAYTLRIRNEEAVRRLDLKPNLLVIVEEEVEVEGRRHVLRDSGVVSSIKNGIVYFRGGNGRCAPASRLRRPTKREAEAIRSGKRFL